MTKKRSSSKATCTAAVADLLAEVKFVKPAADAKSTIPVLSMILVGIGENAISLVATNLDVTLRSQCVARADGAASLCVRSADLVAALRPMVDSSDEEVTVEIDEASTMITLTCGSTRVVLLGLPEKDYPTVERLSDNHSFTVSGSTLRAAVSRVAFSITTEETRFQLNGALLDVDGSQATLVATDGHRMAICGFDLIKSTKRFRQLIPTCALRQFAQLTEEEIHFGKSDLHVFFVSGSRSVSARCVDVQFPNYTEVIAKNPHHILVDRLRLKHAIDATAVTTPGRTRAMRLEFSPGTIVALTRDPEVGESRDCVPADYAGPEFFVGVNAQYVRQFLDAADDAPTVQLDARDHDAQIIFRPASTAEKSALDYTYVVMPMRIE